MTIMTMMMKIIIIIIIIDKQLKFKLEKRNKTIRQKQRPF